LGARRARSDAWTCAAMDESAGGPTSGARALSKVVDAAAEDVVIVLDASIF
jgi:hypothetical protein